MVAYALRPHLLLHCLAFRSYWPTNRLQMQKLYANTNIALNLHTQAAKLTGIRFLPSCLKPPE
jgi:hypothetical protein